MRSIALLFVCVFSEATAFVIPSHKLTTLSIGGIHRPLHSFIDASILDSVTSSVSQLIADGEVADLPGTYSKASYYTVLALYAMSFPGVWSQIKRSTSAKIKRKTFIR